MQRLVERPVDCDRTTKCGGTGHGRGDGSRTISDTTTADAIESSAAPTPHWVGGCRVSGIADPGGVRRGSGTASNGTCGVGGTGRSLYRTVERPGGGGIGGTVGSSCYRCRIRRAIWRGKCCSIRRAIWCGKCCPERRSADADRDRRYPARQVDRESHRQIPVHPEPGFPPRPQRLPARRDPGVLQGAGLEPRYLLCRRLHG